MILKNSGWRICREGGCVMEFLVFPKIRVSHLVDDFSDGPPDDLSFEKVKMDFKEWFFLCDRKLIQIICAVSKKHKRIGIRHFGVIDLDTNEPLVDDPSPDVKDPEILFHLGMIAGMAEAGKGQRRGK